MFYFLFIYGKLAKICKLKVNQTCLEDSQAIRTDLFFLLLLLTDLK